MNGPTKSESFFWRARSRLLESQRVLSIARQTWIALKTGAVTKIISRIMYFLKNGSGTSFRRLRWIWWCPLTLPFRSPLPGTLILKNLRKNRSRLCRDRCLQVNSFATCSSSTFFTMLHCSNARNSTEDYQNKLQRVENLRIVWSCSSLFFFSFSLYRRCLHL